MGGRIPDAPARKAPPERRLFRDAAGRLRAGWLLAAALAGYAAASLAVRLGLNAAFAALFRAWGVNAENVARAPGWARLIYAWHGSAVTLAVNAAVIALSLGLRRLWRKDRPAREARKPALLAWLAGTGFAVLSAALFLAADSLRALWPLSRPNLTPGLLPLWLLSLSGVAAEALFTRRLLYDGLRPRWGSAWALAVSTAAFFFIGGGHTGDALSALNVLLLGLLCGLVYARFGLWAAVGLRWGWSFANAFLLGFGGGGWSVYRLYGVSETLLTGGDAGLICGLWTTLALAAGIVWLARGRLKAFFGRRGPFRRGK